MSRAKSRREAYIKRTQTVIKCKIAIITFVLCLFTSVIFSVKNANAGNFKADTNSVKLYKSIMIYSGDTLESIADTYMSVEYSSVNAYIKEVASMNGISTDASLVPGNHLLIPYYSDSQELNTKICSNPVIEITRAY